MLRLGSIQRGRGLRSAFAGPPVHAGGFSRNRPPTEASVILKRAPFSTGLPPRSLGRQSCLPDQAASQFQFAYLSIEVGYRVGDACEVPLKSTHLRPQTNAATTGHNCPKRRSPWRTEGSN
jgi:hypothetical protein